MTITNYPEGLSSFGFPLFGGPFMSIESVGPRIVDDLSEIFFVSINGSDTAGTGRSPQDPFLTITKAVSMCTASRGSYIFVGEGRFKEQVVITKRGVHLIGMGPYRTQIQAPDAGHSAMTQIDSRWPIVAIAPLTGNGLGVEVANMRIGGNGGYDGIYLGDSNTAANCSGSQVHDCLIDGSNYEGLCGLIIAGGSFVKVSNNIFTSWSVASVVVAAGQTRSAYGNVITANHLVNCKGVGVAICILSNSNVVTHNVIGDSSDGAMSAAISTAGVTGFGACTGTDNFAAGNYLGTTGSLIAMGTNDHKCGNFKRGAGDASYYVTEA